MRLLIAVAAVMVLLSGSAAFALYDGSSGWTARFDLTQGSTGLNTAWNVSGGSWTLNGLYLPDTNFAALNTGINLGGGGNSTVRFILQVDVLVGASNFLQDNGMAAQRTGDGKGPQVFGANAGSQGVASIDTSWNNVLNRRSSTLTVGQWTTLQLDYGYTTAGQWSAYVVDNSMVWNAFSWLQIDGWQPTHPTDSFPTIRIGGVPIPKYGGGWAQAYYSNVRIKTFGNVIPEPSSFIALGAGVIGLLRVVKRQ